MKQGSIIKGEITAIKPYGAFVKIEPEHVGLIHISEFSDGFVRSIEDYVGIGDILDLYVLEVSSDKLSLSYKKIHKRKKRYDIKLTNGFAPLKENLKSWIKNYNYKNDD